MIYFDHNTCRIKRNFHCYIDKNDMKLHPKEYMPLDDLVIQEYPSWVYQTGTPSPDPNIRMIQPTLDISDLPFFSSELLTLDFLLPPSSTPINITIIIYQAPTTSPIANQFPMDDHENIYVVSIDNEDPSLASTAIQLLPDKQKRYRSSSVMLTLSERHPYKLTTLEEHFALFEQWYTLLIDYHT